MNVGMEQNKIDALFATSLGADDASKTAERIERLKRNSYNFGRAGQISNEQMRRSAW